ncbi:MAG: bacterial-like globin family protein [Proteobacteria bacterium]|nr:bacterial-like globin family protein [Pseudomonadota bacterium]
MTTTPSDLTPYAELGGEPAIRDLVNRFYDLMDELPEAYVVRKLHPESLAGSRQKLFEYLCGWLGGPQHYVEKYGHPRMRARHMPFAIGEAERDAWLLCMLQALEEILPASAAREAFRERLVGLADFMRNRDG